MSLPAVHIAGLGFRFPGQAKYCFSNLNLDIAPGERFGLFGPNGAGKTTLMNCMTGLITYHEGTIRLLGTEIKRHDKSINTLFGFVPQDFSFYQELSPAENLAFFGAWSGLTRKESDTRISELLQVLELEDVRNKPVQHFSGGMKRRVNLAIAVMHQPKILFLDEPTVGVDIHTRIAIINYLKTLNENGTTLVYTSHQLSEAEELCNRIALIDEGKIIAHDDFENLLETHQQDGLEGLFLSLTGKKFRE